MGVMLTETQNLLAYSEYVDTVREYIHEHMDQPLNREVLAAVVNFSVPHLHRIFTGCVGENIATYIRRVRLERAGRKLRMGAVDITEVALAAGYQTHSAFGRAFKQQFGLSPSEFRQLDCRTATQLLRSINPHED
jgi:AraC family transcriptional regulator